MYSTNRRGPNTEPWGRHKAYHGSTSPASEEGPRKVPIILLGEQRHIRCEQLAQGCCPNNATARVEPATSRSRVQRSNHYTIHSKYDESKITNMWAGQQGPYIPTPTAVLKTHVYTRFKSSLKFTFLNACWLENTETHHRPLTKFAVDLCKNTNTYFNSHYFQCPVWKAKDDKKQTYMETETCKLCSGVYWIFLPNVIKTDPYNFELYRFKVGAFSETQCTTAIKSHRLQCYREWLYNAQSSTSVTQTHQLYTYQLQYVTNWWHCTDKKHRHPSSWQAQWLCHQTFLFFVYQEYIISKK